MKIKEPFSVFSNIAFLFPLYFSILEKSHLHTFLIAVVFLTSVFFHIIKPYGAVWWSDIKKLNKFQKITLWKDTIFAVALILFNLFIFWQKGFPTLFWYAVIFGLIALYIFFFKTETEKYDFFHGIWHILSGIITLLAVIA